MKKLLLALAIVITTASFSYCDEVSEMRAMIEQLKKQVADVSAKVDNDAKFAKDASGEGAPTSLKMKRSANLKIGGDVNTLYSWNRSNNDWRSNKSFATRSNWTPGKASLNFDVYANDEAHLYIKFDLYDADRDQQGLLEEVYFASKSICGSNFDVLIGKHEVAYGQPDIESGIVGALDGYVHGGGGDGLLRGPSGIRPIGEEDNIYGTRLTYNFRDKAKIEATVFSNGTATGNVENKLTADNGFNSFALQTTISPVENIQIILGMINLHNEWADNVNYQGTPTAIGGGLDADGISWNNATDNWTEFSGAIVYDLNSKCKLITQYMRGYNAGYSENITTDTGYLGAMYSINKNLSIAGSFEIEHINTDGISSDILPFSDIDGQTTYLASLESELYYRATIALNYSFDNGVYIGIDYGREWLELDYNKIQNSNSVTNGSGDNLQADSVTVWYGMKF